MPIGISLHIGVNQTFLPNFGKLNSCINDAISMQNIAQLLSYRSKILKDNEATKQNVINYIQNAADNLSADDIFLLTFSGHGYHNLDLNGDEKDFLDEYWCLFDDKLLDDELYRLWQQFKPGVRILVISDSCHSGTIIQFAPIKLDSNLINHYNKSSLLQNRINHLQQKLTSLNQLNVSVKLLASCSDSNKSKDGSVWGNSNFTEKLLLIWNQGNFVGNYLEFYIAIEFTPKLYSVPILFNVGINNTNFNNQKPFSI